MTNPLGMIRSLVFLVCLTFFSFKAQSSEDLSSGASPQVVAPADVVVSCTYWFSLGMLDDPRDPTFGRFVYGQENIQKFKTIDRVCPSWCEYNDHTGYDPDVATNGKACQHYRRYYNPAHPNERYPLVWGWDGYVNGATSAVEIDVDDRRKCGTGLIIRTFSIFDRGLRYSDEQRIWIVDCDPFYVSDECTDPDDDIEWPLFCQQPRPLDGCYADLSPDNPALGRPRIELGADNQCNLIAMDFKDDTITVEEGACLKVIRTWTVVDWCQFHPLKNPYQGKWEYVQVIKVRDKLDPEMSCMIGECTPAEKDSLGVCLGYIELRGEAIDSCTVTEHLRYEYKIDLFNDGQGPLGDFDVRVGPLSKLSESPTILENPYAEFGDSVLNASGTYPIGEHRLKWFVEDGCGNVALCDTTFVIEDCKAPTPYCKTGIITVVMPSTLSIEVWASDLDDGSFDNCSDSLIFSFSSDTSEQSLAFDCDNIGQHIVEIWVTDEEGNQDFCTTTIEIQDPSDNCPNNLVTGRVISGPQGMVSGKSVEIRLYKNGRLVRTAGLINDTYSMDISGLSGDLELMIFSDEGPLAGVSMADVTTIQRVLLGKETFDSYENALAADVNGDCRLSVGDMSAIGRVILGFEPDFSRHNVPSWIFLPVADPDFIPSDHCITQSKYSIDRANLLGSYDFMPVKMGDVRD